MLTSKLALGPMSEEIIEAVFRYSHNNQIQLMLICSRNQVDYNTGYVFSTRNYMAFINRMKSQYPSSDVVICRDHCGPGFSSCDDSIEDTERTILIDVANGFDLIHIDLCHMQADHTTKIKETMKLMSVAKKNKSDILFEIGTDENIGVAETDTERIATNIDMVSRMCVPEFYVVQTGSLVKENRNVGVFEADAIQPISELLHSRGVKLKEHNADYLEDDQIAKRTDLIDAINIAPQLGVMQTQCVLMLATIYGINWDSFATTVICGRNWAKWMDLNNENNRMLVTLLAGHYHYKSVPYKAIVHSIEKHTSVKENVMAAIDKVIHHYVINFGA